MHPIFFIRHGQSESNSGAVTEYPKTTNLTDLGRKQADRLAAVLNQPPDLIITSSYSRAIQTALPTMDKYPEARREEWNIHEFTYLNPMKYYKTTKVDRKPMTKKYWEALDPESHDREAESFYDFYDRCLEAYEKLQGRKERIFIFTHGHVIRMWMWFFMVGIPQRRLKTMKKYSYLRNGLYIPNAGMVNLSLSSTPEMSPILTGHLPEELLTNTDKFPA